MTKPAEQKLKPKCGRCGKRGHAPGCLFDYGNGLPEDSALMRSRDGFMETRVRLVGVERVLKKTPQAGGFKIDNNVNYVALREQRHDLGMHYAKIFQGAVTVRESYVPTPEEEAEDDAAIAAIVSRVA